jgi:hypothetical protein
MDLFMFVIFLAVADEDLSAVRVSPKLSLTTETK